jgi:hypothetical protein
VSEKEKREKGEKKNSAPTTKSNNGIRYESIVRRERRSRKRDNAVKAWKKLRDNNKEKTKSRESCRYLQNSIIISDAAIVAGRISGVNQACQKK